MQLMLILVQYTLFLASNKKFLFILLPLRSLSFIISILGAIRELETIRELFLQKNSSSY